MNAFNLLEAFEMLDEKYVFNAKEAAMNTQNKSFRIKKTAVLIAAAILSLALCGFAIYELGLFDPWFQKPSAIPTETVKSAIEGQLKKDYTILVRIDEILVDEEETDRWIEMYSGSDLVKSKGWTDEYIKNHFLAVQAKYYVEYDHTKTFMPDGNMNQYFYLIEDENTGMWTVFDNTTGIH